MKRGQLTIFIIIAILIIAVVALFFVFRGNLNLPGKPASPETAEIQNFVQECLDDSLEKVVFRIGENGGYYSPPKISTTLLEVSYYIKDNKNLMPAKEKIQEEISNGVSRELILCLEDFAQFPEYEITKGKINSPEVIIEPDRILVDVNYPLTITRENSKSKLGNFNSEVPVRLGIVYDAVAEFIGEEFKTEGFCMTCLAEKVLENDLKVSYSNYDERTYLFIIEDPQSKINENEFVYIFANEYS